MHFADRQGDPNGVRRPGSRSGHTHQSPIPLPACGLRGTLWLSHFAGPLHAVLDRAWVTSQRSCDERTNPVSVPFYCSRQLFRAVTPSLRPIAPFLMACNLMGARALSLPGIQQVPGSPNAKTCAAQRRPITRHSNYSPNPGELSTISGWSRSLRSATQPPFFISVEQSP
jgi:hypothetical protein